MGEEANQLKEHIAETRDELGRNIANLQAKVEHTFDWRAQFRERPMTLLATAFGAGLVLSGMRSRKSTFEQNGMVYTVAEQRRGGMMKGLLIGIAAGKWLFGKSGTGHSKRATGVKGLTAMPRGYEAECSPNVMTSGPAH